MKMQSTLILLFLSLLSVPWFCQAKNNATTPSLAKVEKMGHEALATHIDTKNLNKQNAINPSNTTSQKHTAINTPSHNTTLSKDKKTKEEATFPSKKAPSAAQLKQRQKMKECNQQAIGKKGQARQDFMRSCLSK